MDKKADIWNLPEFAVEIGFFEPDWQSLKQYNCPEWFREAKLGFWSHTSPQSYPEYGDWYARMMYMQPEDPEDTKSVYNYHCRRFGHPSEFGYKDICHLWTCEGWDPEMYIQLGINAGARYFCTIGNHHDNFDCWDSRYQPWNSVNIGPKKDIVGTWKKLCDQYGLHFGVTFHTTPGRTWNQFMPKYYASDTYGEKAGVPYDGNLTEKDGTGTWWEGMNPQDLYGLPHIPDPVTNDEPDYPACFVNQFMHRVDDVLKYDPDMLYFDDSIGYMKELGTVRGLGLHALSPKLAAHFYNTSMKKRDGRLEAVLFMKDIGGPWNTVWDEEQSIIEKSVVNDFEKIRNKDIQAYPWQTETSFGEWHYHPDMHYMTAEQVIHEMVDVVSKNGNYMISICQRGDGSVDEELKQILQQIGTWMRKNGEAIYGSRPYEIAQWGDDLFFTRKNGNIYVINLSHLKGNTTIPCLGTESATCGQITRVHVLETDANVPFEQTRDALVVELNGPCVLKLEQDKNWINDDDRGVTYTGWYHLCNLDAGDYNNDGHFSEVEGEICIFNYIGTGIMCYARTGPAYGKAIISIDGHKTAEVSLNGETTVQQRIYGINGLPYGEHTITITNAGEGMINIDAFQIV